MSDWNIAIERALQTIVPTVERILEEYPYLPQKAENLREVKMGVIENLESYVSKTMRSIEKSGGKAYLAKDVTEARSIVRSIVDSGKKVVMSKSNVAHEIGLLKVLESNGNEISETDLGAYMIQISNDESSHIVAPSLHMSREKMAEILHNKFGIDLANLSTHEDVVTEVRKILMHKYLEADIGITGANAISADTGSVALVENEGNIRLDSVLPPVHIVITGIDKIVPTLADAMNEIIVQSAYAGIYPPTYINISTGPSSTAVIELKRVTPATGPREFHVILLDNGRMEASMDEDMKEALLCIKCGRCYFSCPVYRVMGKNWGKQPYGGPTGAMWSAIVNRDLETANYCTHSGGCREVCPVKIDIPKVIEHIKWLSQG